MTPTDFISFNKGSKKASTAVYIHGKGGNAQEAERFAPLFPNNDVLGFDYKSNTPWEAKVEFLEKFTALQESYNSITVIGNSIGAFFTMSALSDFPLKKAYFISPIVDMKMLIYGMMSAKTISESELFEKKEIPTQSGETLSWEYLQYVKNNPIKWNCPTHILYGENDVMMPFEAVKAFADSHAATLTVMKNGEHWFHTDEQLAFCDKWINDYKEG